MFGAGYPRRNSTCNEQNSDFSGWFNTNQPGNEIIDNGEVLQSWVPLSIRLLTESK